MITGSFDFASRDEIKDKLKELGAKISESVGKKTDFVMVGSDPGSKFEKARELGITIIGEKEFREITQNLKLKT